MKLWFITSLTVAALALLPAAALGSSNTPGAGQYTNEVSQVAGEKSGLAGVSASGGAGDATIAQATLDALPFTGVGLLWIAALGCVLLLAGFMLRGRRRASA